MPETSSFPHGTFNWIELSTTDTDAAKTFYSELFGWETEDSPVPGGVYTMCKKDGAYVGAIQSLQEEMRSQGHPPFWMSYVSVDDVDSAAARAEELGGKVVAPPFDVMDAGRMAIVQDPTNAALALWQAKDHPGAGRTQEPGSLSWNELSTGDTSAARDFYTGLFGWSAETSDMGGTDYTVFSKGDRQVAGMMAITPEMGPMPPSWGIYVEVEDPDETAARVKDLGGNVFVPPTDFPGGRFSLVTDPQGAAFGIVKAVPPPDAG
ncbi:MAG TPA: VOC family protein [Actinomycetota bacterium]|nr:VOC family protein [Actinomycetota bacterium]